MRIPPKTGVTRIRRRNGPGGPMYQVAPDELDANYGEPPFLRARDHSDFVKQLITRYFFIPCPDSDELFVPNEEIAREFKAYKKGRAERWKAYGDGGTY